MVSLKTKSWKIETLKKRKIQTTHFFGVWNVHSVNSRALYHPDLFSEQRRANGSYSHKDTICDLGRQVNSRASDKHRKKGLTTFIEIGGMHNNGWMLLGHVLSNFKQKTAQIFENTIHTSIVIRQQAKLRIQAGNTNFFQIDQWGFLFFCFGFSRLSIAIEGAPMA